MTVELASVLALLAMAIVMFAINRPRMDAVALIVLAALPLTGVLTIGEALEGFSDPNIVLIAALFVIGDGLVRTGVARNLGDWLTKAAGSSETRLIVLLMLVVCMLGSTMSSTAVTAIFIPVALRVARKTGTSPSQLLMPLSSAALVSGMMTLVATAPNLVVNSELVRHGFDGFRFFSLTPFGLPILALCIVYMLFARHWLPKDNGDGHGTGPARPSMGQWVTKYKLADREHRVRVTPESPLVGTKLDDLKSENVLNARLVAIQRNGTLVEPTPNTEIHARDVLLVDLVAPIEDVEQELNKYSLKALPLTGAYFSDYSQDLGLVEVIVPADSEFIGQSVISAQIRDRFGLNVIGLRRGQEAREFGLLEEELKVGDTLLLVGPWRAIQAIQAGGRDLVALNLPAEQADVLPVPGKAVPAIICLVLVVLLMVTGIVPNVHAALLGCLLMGALGCVNLESAYRCIDWKTIVLIVGMLPFSLALQRTGGVDLASEGLMALTSGMGTHGILAALFAITALLGMFISNTATAVLMAPVAIAVAEELQSSPYPFAMIVALAASTAFMTPVSSPVNTLVVTPGGYRFGDFVRVGVPFSLIVLVVSVFLVPWLLPL